MPPYRRPQTYARKDLLSPGGYNQLSQNAQALDTALRVEHTADGAHNSPLIARTVGTVQVAAGPVYSLLGFNGDVSLDAGFNPVVGRVVLTLPQSRYFTSLPVCAQNASATGASLPCLTTARWLSPPGVNPFLVSGQIEVFSTYWNGTLDTPGSGSWAITAYGGGQDASFHLLVHGDPTGAGAVRTYGQPLVSRQGNRAGTGSTYTNQLIQGTADLEAALRAEHTGGTHDLASIPKCWAHVQWNGSRYVILDQEASPNFTGGAISSVELVDDGVAEVVFVSTIDNVLQAQMFVDVDYPRLYGSTADYHIACCPQGYKLGNVATVFFYKKLLSGAGEEYWTRDGGTDFHVWVYAT